MHSNVYFDYFFKRQIHDKSDFNNFKKLNRFNNYDKTNSNYLLELEFSNWI